MAGPRVVITGMEELKANLATLPARVEAKILRGALRKGADTVLAAVKSEAPEDKGYLKYSLQRAPIKRKRGKIGFFVAPRPGHFRTWFAKHGYYPEIIRHGRTRWKRPKDAKHRKLINPKYIVQPNDYLLRGFHKVESRVQQQLRVDIATGIVKEAEKAARTLT